MASIRIRNFSNGKGVAFLAGVSKRSAMKHFTLFAALLIVLVSLGLGACERHDFESTKRLHSHEEDAHKKAAH
jgi:hypothetical protein